MSKIQAPRGTHDVILDESGFWQFIEHKARVAFNASGFKEIRTPIFEATELFSRAVGEDSDIVNKEMYTFLDRGERSMTLRPEGTAGVARSYIEHNLDRNQKPIKLWYQGPMFRYERPQTGRYRQFHQIGAEALGSDGPYIDLEMINLGIKFLSSLGLENLTLYINSIGNKNSRTNYTNALKDFLNGLADQVCEDCKRRMSQNPLRCLDCKVPADQDLYKNAPVIHEFFDEESSAIWQKILSGLKTLEINFVVDPKLVRGLDYYNHCVFEIKTSSTKLAGQSTVLAGGRYDNLVSYLGGAPTPACGWACGQERIVELLKEKGFETEKSPKLFIISDDGLPALTLANQLRDLIPELTVEIDYELSKFKKQLEKALKRNCDWIIFFMTDERDSGKIKLKNTKTTQEESFESINAVCDFIKKDL
jgi:histidyl-tRNA synthetase